MTIYRINKTNSQDTETEWEVIASASGHCSLSLRRGQTWEVVAEYPNIGYAFAHMVNGKSPKKSKKKTAAK